MKIEIETQAEAAGKGWKDKDGFIGPYKPGFGPRTDPRGEFPTGPALGNKLLPFSCTDADGKQYNFDPKAMTSPTVLMFFRSAVW